VIQALAQELARAQPFPILADSLAVIQSPFWQSRLLRWRVRSTLDLRTFSEQVERALAAEGIRAHFPLEGGWLPRYVTALEDVRAGDVDGFEDGCSFPCRLFDARRLVFSMIEEGHRFRILGRICLAGD
jgi:hypothetical protein